MSAEISIPDTGTPVARSGSAIRPVPIANSMKAFYGVGLLIPEIILIIGGLVWLRQRQS